MHRRESPDFFFFCNHALNSCFLASFVAFNIQTLLTSDIRWILVFGLKYFFLQGLLTLKLNTRAELILEYR